MMNYNQNTKNSKINLKKFGKLFISLTICLLILFSCSIGIFADTTPSFGTFTNSHFYLGNGIFVFKSSSLGSPPYFGFNNLIEGHTYTLYWKSYPYSSIGYQYVFYTSANSDLVEHNLASSGLGYGMWSNDSYLGYQYYTFTQENYTTSAYGTFTYSSDNVFHISAIYNGSSVSSSTIRDGSNETLYNTFSSMPNIYIVEGDKTAIYDQSGDVSDVPRLGTPVLSLDGTVLSWNSIPNASGYSLQRVIPDAPLEDRILKYLPSSQHVFSILDLPAYYQNSTFVVQAMGDGVNYEDSYVSNTVSRVVWDISYYEAPILSFSNFSLHWTPVEECFGYYVYKNGDLVGSTDSYSDTTFNISDLGSGIYTVKCKDYFDNDSHIAIYGTLSNSYSFIPTTPSGSTDITIGSDGNTGFSFESATQWVLNLNNNVKAFFNAFGDFFSFLPPEILSAIVGVFVILCVIVVIKFLL